MTSQRNPKDSMKSTWRHDKRQWGLQHYILDFVNAYSTEVDTPVPVHAKTDPVPFLTETSCHLYILTHAAWPLALQWLYTQYTGHNLNPIFAFFLYLTAFRLNVIHEVRILRRLAHKVGFLDGEAPRDNVPDVGVAKVLASVMLTTAVRPIFTIFLSYRASEPVALSWWLPVELSLYTVILDLWFYAYHRACHEVPWLWQYHRTHHLTKHPTPLLSAYADAEQETLEIALIPMATWATLKLMGFPMGFYDWWICHQYLIFSESFGHSGLRIYSNPPSPISWLLRWLKADLVLEDHDLHHRKGYRTSANYGKQTRLWDRVFGTCGERIEAIDANVNYDDQIDFPLL